MRGTQSLLVLVLAGFSGAASAQTVLFRDDFSGTTFDKSVKWMVGTWDMGRAKFGNVPVVSDGFARLKVDTYNVDAPGVKFRGTEIMSRTNFSRGTGLEFESRMRVNSMPDGIVSGMYTFAYEPGSPQRSDEIDYEFVSKWINHPPVGGDRVLMTQWNDWNPATSKHFDQVHHTDARPVIAGLDLNNWNTFKIRWLPDRTEWVINGALAHTSANALPDEPMPIKFNIWPAASVWGDAYNALLLPTAVAAANQSWSFDVDYAEVRTIGPVRWILPEPGSVGVMGVGVTVVLLKRRRRERDRGTAHA